jgi:hypothetical protein
MFPDVAVGDTFHQVLTAERRGGESIVDARQMADKRVLAGFDAARVVLPRLECCERDQHDTKGVSARV